MKKIILTIFVLIILLSVISYYINNNPIPIASFLSKKDTIGPQELTYRVNLFGIIPVATVVLSRELMEDYNGQKVYHLNAVGKPLNWVVKLFNGYAILDSYVDTQTYNPLLFKQEIALPDKGIASKEVRYDQKNRIMTLNNIERQILPDTQDPLSLLFNIRRIDFSKVKKLEININTNQKNYLFKAIAQSQDMSIYKKTYKIIFLQADIRRRDKNPYHQSKVSMALLRGKENIPLLVKVFASGVLINAKLIDFK